MDIKVNDHWGPYFQTKKIETRKMVKWKGKGPIWQIMVFLSCNTLITWCYFQNHDIEQARNMKLLLCTFEQLLGFKINFHRSEIFCFGETKHYDGHYS